MGRHSVAGMPKLARSIVSMLARRFRSRAVVEAREPAPRHQLHVLCRQRPGRLRLFAIDRLLWVLLYRLWPRCLEAMLLVKPATAIQWHRQGFRLFWRWRSRSGRPSVEREIRDLIRQMYVDYYQRTRTHLSLDKDCPDPRQIMPHRLGKVVTIPQVGRPASSLRTSRRLIRIPRL